MIGVPALTGQNILELLTTGDSKDAWNKTKNLFKKMGIEIGSFFSSTNKEAINPAIGNMLFGSMTVGEARRYFDYKDGKYTLDQNKFGEYLAEQAQKETDPVKKKALQDKLAIYKKMLAEKQLGEVGNDWGNTIGLNEVADTGKTTQELYEAYIEGLSLGAGLLEGDTKLRIKDKDAFNKYIREQIIDKKRNPSDITKKDLLDAGLLEEIPETTDTNNQNQDQNQNNPNNGNNNAPNAAPDVEPGTWEKITNWTADKWGKFKDGVKSTSKTVGAFAASVYTGEIFHRNDSEKLKRLRESLNTAKETLKELKKQNAIMTDLAIKETDIHLLELEIEETESQIIKMGAMMADELDPTLVPADTTLLTWLSSENKKEMTRGIRKINFLIKFQSPNDECRFILE